MPVDKRELLLDLLARDKTKQATDSASKNLDGVADAADDAAKSTDKLSKAAKQNADRLDKLDREAHLAKRELESLARAFTDTEDAAERADLSKGIRKLEADLAKLGKNKKILEGILPDPGPDGRSFGGKLVGAIGEGATSLATKAGTAVGPVVGGAIAAAAAPVLISTLGSALSAGAGAGVLGAGIMLAVKGDKQIQAAGAQLGKDFIGGLQESAGRNFSGPIRESLGIIGDAGERVTKKWDKAFRDLSSSVVPLTDDLVRAGERINNSLVKVASDSGPALDGLGDSSRLLADGVGDFIDKVSDGGPEAASNMRLLAGATADLARYTGNALGELNKLSNNPFLTGVLPSLRKHYEDAAAGAGVFAPRVKGAADGIEEVGDAAASAEDPLDTFIQQLKDGVEAGQSLYDSQTDVAEALDKAREAAKENGETTDANTEKGRANREALSNLATQLRENYTKYVELNGASGQANVVAEQNRKRFIEVATVMTGSAAKARKLADEILGIPKTAGTKVSINDTQATKEIKAYIAMLRKIPAYKRTVIETARVVTNFTGSDSALDSALRKQKERGGPVRKGEAYLVGEKRPEVFVPDRDGKIIPSIEQFARGGGAMGRDWSGGGTQYVPYISRTEVIGDREIVALFRRLIRTHNLLQIS